MSTRRRCTPQAWALEKNEISALLSEIGSPPWRIEKDILIGEWHFSGFAGLARFLRALLSLSTRQNHHPQVFFGYSDCRVSYTTHSAGGISENDFICAAEINRIMSKC